MILDGKNATRCIAIHKGNYLTTQNVILRNGATGSGSSGGGIAVCWHNESEKAHLSLTDTEIYGCAAGVTSGTAGKYGGAINTYNNADVSMSNVNFHDNYANWGGSAIYMGNLVLSGSIVLGKDDVGNGVFEATIVVSGDTICLVLGSMGIMLASGMNPTFAMFAPFVFMLGVTMVAAPGVPGGGVMSALGLITSMLGFTDPMQQLIIALHFSQDSFGTATNVTGDQAIALIVDKVDRSASEK